MRYVFKVTKEYEVFIDLEDVDKKYGGSVVDAIDANLDKAEEIDSYDFEIIEEERHFDDLMYQASQEAAYQADRDLQESLYLRDLI